MSRQPHKQRNEVENASLHELHRYVQATLSSELREEYDTRRTRVNAGDTVEVMRGDHAGQEGEVVQVDLKDSVLHVEDVTVETADGEEVPRPLDPSNVRIIDLDLSDDRREERLQGDTQ
ncbi:50S ribosomal protein L24 [Natranaeroarchaeum sulfidigenes]|uniref:Large ribosomal subunit protein uL24 n=1 Tax=Natranaeroarchaeum sulfidigenes TaxID=2784880 RepID=A0A897MP83_9EURY|nr:50S ribosomal protein L24 [Natranaeroarchaeum sulfidigenes]QSG02367.1 Ribosomal protein L24 [Natranaeroarchaeum sulfidigenes]